VELRKLVQALEQASKDPRVRGLLAVLGNREHLGGMAMVQELRDSIRAFNLAAAGRSAPSVACASAFGEAGTNGTVPLYLASACSQVGEAGRPDGALGGRVLWVRAERKERGSPQQLSTGMHH
jgi:hypothetical protein